jgi:hypothetical protein
MAGTRRLFDRVMVAVALATVLAGCAPVPFVPISWGMRDRVLALSREDVALAILYARYDPGRETLRIDGPSFDEFERLENATSGGAYRQDVQLIYRNSETRLNGRELRNTIVHEFAHHIWCRYLTGEQKEEWRAYLQRHPNRWQVMVRKVYPDPQQHDGEDFAYTVEFPRAEDIAELAGLRVITADEAERWRKAEKGF